MSAGFFDSWRVQCAMRGALSEEREAMITRLEDEWITCTEERRREIFTQYQVYTGMRPPPTERPKPSPESIASQMDARMPPQYDAETRKAALDFLQRALDDSFSWSCIPDKWKDSRRSKLVQLFGSLGLKKAASVDKERCSSKRLAQLLLAHSEVATHWRTENFKFPFMATGRESRALISCIVELLLCIGDKTSPLYLPPAGTAIGGDGRPIPSLLHLLASGGCDPDVWDDTPEPLPPALQRRLIRWCALLGGDVEVKDPTHWATPLSWSCWFDCEHGARSMLCVGSNRNATDRHGLTSKILARQRTAFDLDDLLDPTAQTIAKPASTKECTPEEREARHKQIETNRDKLKGVHAGWVEESARMESAWGARMAAKACDAILEGKMLPGPALQAIANELMTRHFALWSPTTTPKVSEWADGQAVN